MDLIINNSNYIQISEWMIINLLIYIDKKHAKVRVLFR